MTPTSRTLKLLRSEGKIVEVTERWNCFTRQRKDLFGFIDIIALDVNMTWGIQCTSTSNLKKRVDKIINECRDFSLAWLSAGNKIEVIGWSKKGKKGKRKVWTPTRKIITLSDIQ